ncbi:E3 ubiquitin-protein ligase TRIM13 isoform X2 [Protopterus annectens]|nr:E3 ubiquitin-protein ligase TRIM13 isoform X2 [Protopterus annectens]XP_043927412.1 E3 ubiquitin-protein ligase TRIM13 isoform X2 [Protopterus annectens]XP_043927413.1 E3 ubiquitin-protein ligase TRIM13 isoform X2 [Protopterus annectens]
MELLEEDLTCPICCCLFEDPRVLPCSHSFCRKCLENILEGNTRGMLWRPPFKCPTCRKEVSVVSISSLQVNYSLRGIVEKYNKIKISPKMPVCEVHSGQPLNMFCSTDLRLICGCCATGGDHAVHAFCSIEDACRKEKEAFEQLFRGVEVWHRADVLSCLEALDTNKKTALQLLTKHSEAVASYFEKLQCTVDQKKNEILSDFETMKLMVMQAYDPEINKMSAILEEQRKAFSIAESFKDMTDPLTFLLQMQEFREKLKVIKETPLPSCTVGDGSPLMEKFDPKQWDSTMLKDIDKLTLPQEISASKFQLPYNKSESWPFLIITLLIVTVAFVVAALFSQELVLDNIASLKTHLSVVSMFYLPDSEVISSYAAQHWTAVVDYFFVLCQDGRDYTEVLLKYIVECFYKYKLV